MNSTDVIWVVGKSQKKVGLMISYNKKSKLYKVFVPSLSTTEKYLNVKRYRLVAMEQKEGYETIRAYLMGRMADWNKQNEFIENNRQIQQREA